ncbi:MAG: hypothetical protein EOO01_12610 [Chitinophagaceae bacterium]|nr:MAG: hypothetical protein EOO01_12610 [Chitinophagaceae bacterium]
MQSFYNIEIRLNDYIDRQLLNRYFIKDGFLLAVNVGEQIDEEVGGLLCVDHCALPEMSMRPKGKDWILYIRCCCDKHQEEIHKRVQQFLR